MEQTATQPIVSAQPTKLKSKSLWMDAYQRLLRNPVAVITFFIIVAYLLLALLCAMGIAFPNYSLVDNTNTYKAPSAEHWFGTDLFGRDVLARAAHGTITSLIVGFFGALL